MNWEPNKYIFGLRHRRAFRFISLRGQLIDAIVALQGREGIPKDSFQQVEFKNDETLFTVRGEIGLVLQFGLDGFILTFDVEKNENLNTEMLSAMAKSVAEATFGIVGVGENINRLGLIHEFVFPKGTKATSELRQLLLKNSLDEPEDMNSLQVRSTFRYPVSKSLTSPKTNDYKNVIISIASQHTKENKQDIILAVDFQVIFDPMKDLSKIEIVKHIESGVKFCNKLKNGSLKTLVSGD